MTPVNKILLTLQFYAGDKALAGKLARFIADLEAKHSDLADFLLVSRFDCSQEQELVQTVAAKFNCYQWISKRRGVGWPVGPNDLMTGATEWCYHMIEAKKVPPYKAIFLFEADCVPLERTWVARLSQVWDDLNSSKRVFVAGAMQPQGPDGSGHINGNCLLSGDIGFLQWLSKRASIPPSQGWDYYLAPRFKQWGWADIPGLKSYWGTTTFNQEWFDNEMAAGTFFIHGCKDDSLLNLARKRLIF